jgi:hypothetical protein
LLQNQEEEEELGLMISRRLEREQRQKLRRVGPSWGTERARVQVEALLSNGPLFLLLHLTRRPRAATRVELQRRHGGEDHGP